MKVLFTGKGTSGSWKIRAEQIGAAMGATVAPKAPQGNHDISVVVKRLGVPQRRWVWDLVDFYPQPAAYHWTRDQAVKWVQEQIRLHKPSGVIWPTKRMREDCDNGLPGLVLPHHHRPGLKAEPDPTIVGYEGGEQYLGKWRPALEAECQRRGLKFMVNPSDYGRLSTVVAVRDGGGYVCRNWKSGVKISNAVAIGAKFIGQPESGYLEQSCGGEAWVESPSDLASAFDSAVPLNGPAFTVEQAADRLKTFLDAL